MGEIYQFGLGADNNYQEAARLYGLACRDGKAGYIPACTRIADLYAYGLGVERDPDEAMARYDVACRAGSNRGCMKFEEYNITEDGGVIFYSGDE